MPRAFNYVRHKRLRYWQITVSCCCSDAQALMQPLPEGCRPDLTDNAVKELEKLLQSRTKAVSMMCQLASYVVDHLGDHDFYVSPPAAEAICAYSQHYEVRRRLMGLKLLPIIMDMLKNRLPLVEEPAVQVLREFGKYADVQSALIQDGYIKRLKSMMASSQNNAFTGGTVGLLGLIHHQYIRWVATHLGTINMIVKRLQDPEHSLFAAYALSWLIKNDVIRPVVVESAAPKYLLGLLERNAFTGAVENETGEKVLRSLLKSDDLRAAIVKAGAMDTLVGMLRSGVVTKMQAVLAFLHVLNNHDDGVDVITVHAHDLVEAALHPLSSQQWSQQRHGTCAIHELAMMSELEKEVHENGIPKLLTMLSSKKPCEVLGAATALRALSHHKHVRTRVRRDIANFKSEFYGGTLGLIYEYMDPCEADVGYMIGKMFASMEEGADHTRDLLFPDVRPTLTGSPLMHSLKRLVRTV
ncbi:ARM repeat-containing protein [Paxillus ammoniavirescens]|nr:ARM repeat-containing protein [Paxillus ammoniavirescens]